MRTVLTCCLGFVVSAAAVGPAGELSPASVKAVPVGVARADVTPSHPVRLVGYAGRTQESEGVAGRLWAKALAIGGDEGEGPAVLLTVDNCGVPDNVVEDLAERLRKKAGVKRERFAVCSSHTHNGPWLDGYLPYHYSEPIPESHRENMRRYTRWLTDAAERVALDALAARKPGLLSWAQGTVGFAANRRVLKDGRWAKFGVQADGPVDHSLPLLCVSNLEGKPLAVVLNYACHGTTLTTIGNQVHGDWAGCAQELIEAEHPGVVSLVTVGCGGDANPEPRGGLDVVQAHGRSVAEEVKRLLQGKLTPINPELTARWKRIRLPFDSLPTRSELGEMAKDGGRKGDLARALLAALDSGTFPTSLDYSVGTWSFGDDLAMIFLPGEVVVDYALRLKRDFDGRRLWVTAYANDVPCYIPSKRILNEGGYEADSSMVSYAQPARLAPETEEIIVSAVRELLPANFRR